MLKIQHVPLAKVYLGSGRDTRYLIVQIWDNDHNVTLESFQISFLAALSQVNVKASQGDGDGAEVKVNQSAKRKRKVEAGSGKPRTETEGSHWL